MLKDVYAFLQAKSKNFPWVSSIVMKSFFIDKLDLGANSVLEATCLNNIVLEVCVQGELARKEKPSRVKQLCRYQYFETLIRFSQYLYTNAYTGGQDKNKPTNEYEQLTASQAFWLFVENKIKPFYKNANV